jgi:hypothetical protein
MIRHAPPDGSNPEDVAVDGRRASAVSGTVARQRAQRHEHRIPVADRS